MNTAGTGIDFRRLHQPGMQQPGYGPGYGGYYYGAAPVYYGGPGYYRGRGWRPYY